jgi:murein DD-endopeptidase MepM/ murein hydrolase activator NlpD
MTYPLASTGKVIGTPGQGTHSYTAAPNNWESDRAVDLATPVGTPVLAVADGTIGSQIGSLGLGGRFAGLRVNLHAAGDDYYYAHLSRLVVRAGQTVKRGQILGYSGSANGVAHLHFGQRVGDPARTIGAANNDSGGGFLGIPGAVSDTASAVGDVADGVADFAKDPAGAILDLFVSTIGKYAPRIALTVLLVVGGLALAITGIKRLATAKATA